MSPRLVLFFLAAAAFAGALAWSAVGGRSAPQLALTGSSTIAPLAAEIAKRYEREHPGALLSVQTGGSSRGIRDVQRGLAEVGMVSRSLTPAERTELEAHPIARDGIGLIVHRDNAVRELSREQVVAIYTGQIRSWRALGGPDRPITVIHKAAGRSTHDLFLEHFELDPRAVMPSLVIGDNEHAVKSVATNVDAIAYVSIGTAEHHAARGVAIRLVALDGVEASQASVASGAYPLARTLHLVTRGALSPAADSFVRYAQSPAVHDLVRHHAFVPPTP